jgi:hypothetical protein
VRHFSSFYKPRPTRPTGSAIPESRNTQFTEARNERTEFDIMARWLHGETEASK